MSVPQDLHGLDGGKTNACRYSTGEGSKQPKTFILKLSILASRHSLFRQVRNIEPFPSESRQFAGRWPTFLPMPTRTTTYTNTNQDQKTNSAVLFRPILELLKASVVVTQGFQRALSPPPAWLVAALTDSRYSETNMISEGLGYVCT